MDPISPYLPVRKTGRLDPIRLLWRKTLISPWSSSVPAISPLLTPIYIHVQMYYSLTITINLRRCLPPLSYMDTTSLIYHIFEGKARQDKVPHPKEKSMTSTASHPQLVHPPRHHALATAARRKHKTDEHCIPLFLSSEIESCSFLHFFARSVCSRSTPGRLFTLAISTYNYVKLFMYICGSSFLCYYLVASDVCLCCSWAVCLVLPIPSFFESRAVPLARARL